VSNLQNLESKIKLQISNLKELKEKRKSKESKPLWIVNKSVQSNIVNYKAEEG
jgi:hypothetical protein